MLFKANAGGVPGHLFSSANRSKRTEHLAVHVGWRLPAAGAADDAALGGIPVSAQGFTLEGIELREH